MQVWWLFTIKTFDIFEYMQVFLHFWHQHVDFFEYMQVWWTSSPSNLHILKKVKHFDREKSPNLHILKKKIDSEKSPNLHILKKIKKIKNQVIYASESQIESEILILLFFWVYAGLATFHYQNFWFFWVYAGFLHFWHQNVDFFEYMQVWWTSSPSNLHILKKRNILIGKSYKTCIYSKKSKKIKKPSHLRQWLPHRVWDFWFFWFFWAYAGSLSIFSIFLSICRCCALLASKCWFFWIYAGYVHSKQNNAFFASHAGFGEV